MTLKHKTYGLNFLIATKNDSPTSFVLVFSFVKYISK